MTSTYDALGALFYRAMEDETLKKLVLITYDYAIAEITKVNPKTLNWEDWSKKNTLERFIKLYGKKEPELHQKADFISDAHSLLDHNRKYHLRTVHRRLDFIIEKLRHWFSMYRDREAYSRYWGITEFKPATIRRYPKVFKELKRMIDAGIIDVSWLDKRRRKKIERWEKYFAESE